MKRAKRKPPPDRSAIMRAVPGRDTSAEMKVRRLLRPIAPGYRLHRKDVPGNPDIAYVGAKKAIFVHGCFWHGHGCALDRAAATFKAGAWARKIAVNQAQFDRDRSALRSDGWLVETVWECQIDDRKVIDRLAARLLRR